MTWTEIANRLATIDPALTEQQRCVHEWKVIDRLFQGSVLRHRCSKCGYEAASDDITPVPLVGDGDNEERYGTVDELFGLCDRLGLHWVMGDQSCDTKMAYAKINQLCDWQFEQTARQALATAICKTMGVGV